MPSVTIKANKIVNVFKIKLYINGILFDGIIKDGTTFELKPGKYEFSYLAGGKKKENNNVSGHNESIRYTSGVLSPSLDYNLKFKLINKWSVIFVMITLLMAIYFPLSFYSKGYNMFLGYGLGISFLSGLLFIPSFMKLVLIRVK